MPSAKPNPFDILFRIVWVRLAYLLFWAVYLMVLWKLLGPGNPIAGLGVLWATSALVPAIPATLSRRLPEHWFRVPAAERAIHRMIGVRLFGRLLDSTQWNRRVVEPLRGFEGGKANLPILGQNVRAATCSHGVCFAIHAILAIAAIFGEHPVKGALWMLMPGVAVHLYAVLLQRSIMLRLQPLLVRVS